MSIKELSQKDKATFYKNLASMNLSQAAASIGLDKEYTNPSTLRSVAYKLYKSIAPEEVGISQDTVDIVTKAISTRKATDVQPAVESDLINPEDTRAVIIGGRNKAAMLLHKKMDRISRNKKLLDQIPLSQLATTFGIFFDKAQIIQGQATENIAVMAKISENMTPEESLEALLRMREASANKE